MKSKIMFKYLTIKNFLTEKECSEILEYSLKNLKLYDARVGMNLKINKELRKSSISFTDYNERFPYIEKKLIEQLSEVIKVKGYQINLENKKYQFTKYDKGQFYGWHTDSTTNPEFINRYCSIVIQLSNQYEGGDLEMIDTNESGEKTIIFEKGIGNLFVFLSKIPHRVTEVTEGTRYSLVGWFELKPAENFKKTIL